MTASWDHTARLWDINTGQTIRMFANHSDSIWSAALSPDGKYLLTGSHDKTARLWIADPTYETRSIHDYSGIISFLPGGGRILLSGSDGTVWVWNVDTLENEKPETIGILQTTSTAVWAQGQWIAARSSDNKTITLWKDTGGRYEEDGIVQMEDIVTSLSFSPSIDGKESEYLLIGMGPTWSARLIGVGTWEPINRYSGNGWVTSVRFTPDGKFVAIGTKTDISIKDIFVDEPGITCNQDTSSIAFSKDGKYLAATAGYDVVLLDWQNPSGCTLFKKLTGHTAGIGSIEFSPDGRYLLSASGDGTAKLWETNTWTVFKTLIGHEGAVLGGAFSPDSSLVVTGGEDHAIRFWDMDYMTTIQSACDLLQSLQRDLSSDERNHYGITDTSPTCSK